MNAHVQNAAPDSRYFVAGNLWQADKDVIVHVNVIINQLDALYTTTFPATKLAVLIAANGLKSESVAPVIVFVPEKFNISATLIDPKKKKWFWVVIVGRDTNLSIEREKLSGYGISFDFVKLSLGVKDNKLLDPTPQQMAAVLTCGLRNARQHFLAVGASHGDGSNVTVTTDELDKGINEALVAIRDVKHRL